MWKNKNKWSAYFIYSNIPVKISNHWFTSRSGGAQAQRKSVWLRPVHQPQSSSACDPILLHHIHQRFVVEVVVIVPHALPIWPWLQMHLQLHKFICLESVEDGAQLLAVIFEKQQQVVFLDAWIADWNIKSKCMFYSIEATNQVPGQVLRGPQ